MIEWMIIFLLIGGMFSLELLNTAIEHTVDLITDKHHPGDVCQLLNQPYVQWLYLKAQAKTYRQSKGI